MTTKDNINSELNGCSIIPGDIFPMSVSNMMSNTTTLSINFSSSDEEGAIRFINMLKDHIDHINSRYETNEIVIEVGGSYWTSSLQMDVVKSQVNDHLVMVDTIKSGLIAGSEDVLSNVFNDIRCVVKQNDISVLAETNNYLLNKIQEQNRTLDFLVSGMSSMVETINVLTKRIDAQTERHNAQDAYIHTYIDLKSLSSLVREIAEKVDPELLEDFKMVMVH